MKNHTEKDSFHRIRRLFSGTVLLVLGACLVLASCKDFFSTTWGEDFARDPSSVKVDSSNVDELLKDANGDTEASRAILDKLAGTGDPKLQAAAVKAANQASGLTGLILSNLDMVTGSDADDPTSLETVAQTVLGEARKNDITGIAGIIAGTLPEPEANFKFPAGSAVASVSTSDLTILLVTMMMAEVPSTMSDFANYAAAWGHTKNIDGTGLNDNEKVIAAIAHEVIDRSVSGDSKLGAMLKSLVGAE